MRMWEIRESDGYRGDSRDSYRYGSRRGSMGMKDHEDHEEKSYSEGYEHGFEDGYTKAMKDTFYSHEKDSYGERRMPR